MGTLQSFTPMPDCAFTLFLLNPSRMLSALFGNKAFIEQFKFQTQKVDKFPLAQLLDTNNSSEKKKIKVIVEEQNLIDICHFALMFHHQIIIIKKSLSLGNSIAKLHKQLKFKDQLSEFHKIYSPIQVDCQRHCPSIEMRDLKNFIENYDEFRDQVPSQTFKSDSKWIQSNVKNSSLIKSIQQPLHPKKQKEIQDIKIRNYKRRSTLQAYQENNNISRQNSSNKNIKYQDNQQNHMNEEDQIKDESLNPNWNVPYLIFSHNPCPFNPISLIINQIPQKMTNKIMNLLKFYKATFIRYPSMQTFFASGCNSTKIICGPTQLQQIAKKVQAQEFPFMFSSLAELQQLSSQKNLDQHINESSMHGNQHLKCISINSESQDITLYCFCNEGFQKDFTTNSNKTIGILKDKLIQIKFFKNLIDLVKELFKDGQIQNFGQIWKQILKEKATLLSNKKIKSNLETGASCQGQNNASKVAQTSVQREQKNTFINETQKSKLFNLKMIRKDSRSYLANNPKYLSKLSQKSISKLNKTSSFISGPNIGSSVSNLPNDQKQLSNTNSKDDRNPLWHINSIVYFVMHEKENDRYAIMSLPKKITRELKNILSKNQDILDVGLKNIKIKRIYDLESLAQKIKHQYTSMVVLIDHPKILQQFYTIVEANAVDDKIILIKRQETDTHQTLAKKIQQGRQVGLVKLQNFQSFSFIHRKIIVVGSKSFLKHIFKLYPYIDVKQFIDVTIYKEHRKIRQVISRKNEVIVSNVMICEVCNLEYRGLVKAKIIYYEDPNEKLQLIAVGGQDDCKCNQTRQNKLGTLKLDKLLDLNSSYTPVYPYMNKKIQSSAAQISVLFTKIKEKKALPIFENYPNQIGQILFLCADSWVIEQITMIIVKLFCNRYTNIWLCPWMAKKIIYDCIKQCEDIIKFMVESIISIYKGQISTKSVEIIQQAKQVYKYLKLCLDQVSDVFQLSQILLELFVGKYIFRKAVNYAWRNLLSLNKHEFPFECCTLFLVLLLGFRKSTAMRRNDSINDGTFKSFRKFQSKPQINPKTCKSSQETQKNDNDKFMQASIKISCSIQKVKELLGQSKNPNNQNQIEKPMFKQTRDSVIEVTQETPKIPISPKIYLKMMNYQKVYQDESLRKFFISKNTAFSYIYTTEFLIFQVIDQKDINSMVSEFVLRNSKNFSNLSSGQFKKQEKAYFQFSQNKNQKKQSNGTGTGNFSVGKPTLNKITFMEQYQTMQPQFFSSFLSMTRSNSNVLANSPPKSKENEILKLKPQKSIEILPSTEDSLIICIQNIQLLNYNIFLPFYRSQSGKTKKKKTFILPPFTKLQINNNYSNVNTLTNPSASLITHQLKLSPEHQQRFLERFLQIFLVQKSQYYENLHEKEKKGVQKNGQMDEKKLFTFENSVSTSVKDSDQIIDRRNGEIIVLKRFSRLKKSGNLNQWDELKLIDQKFNLPYTDQFFILMNEFKYFSAHHLLITQLPKTNMTNAYHAILLTRKGLYHEAQKILLPSNPFRFTIQEYINELKNRMISNNSISDLLQSPIKNHPQDAQKPKVSKVIKWKVSYSQKEEKFYLKEEFKTETAYCYNDDSLDVIYKRVFTKFHTKVQPSTSEVGKQSDHLLISEEDLIGNSQIVTGTFVNPRKLPRRPKKQSSIAFSQKQSNKNCFNNQDKELARQIGNDTSTIQARSQMNKMSMKSRDSILNDMRFFQQIEQKNPMLSGASSDYHRRSRVSHSGSSSFMFGNSYSQSRPSVAIEGNLLRQSSRLSYQKQNLNKKNQIFEINVHEEIEEKSSGSSQSEQNDRKDFEFFNVKEKTMRMRVKTRNKSNFFIENIQEMKKELSLYKQNNLKEFKMRDSILNDPLAQNKLQFIGNDEITSKVQEKLMQINQPKSIVQKAMLSNTQVPTIDILRNMLISQSNKGPIWLFKTFQQQQVLENDSWLTQKGKQLPAQQQTSAQNKIKNQFFQQSKNSIQAKNQPQVASMKNQTANFATLLMDSFQIKTKNNQILDTSNDHLPININTQYLGQIHSDLINRSLFTNQKYLQNDHSSSLIGNLKSHKSSNSLSKKNMSFQKNTINPSNQENQSDPPVRQTINLQNKLKCRFTLEISSQSQDQQSFIQSINIKGSQPELIRFQSKQNPLPNQIVSMHDDQKYERISLNKDPKTDLLTQKQTFQSPHRKLKDYLQMNDCESLSQQGNEIRCSQTVSQLPETKNGKRQQSIKSENQQSRTKKTNLRFNFKKKALKEQKNQVPVCNFKERQVEMLENLQSYSSVCQTSKMKVFKSRMPGKNQQNRISEVSSQNKTQSDEQNKQKDHEAFLMSHTSLLIWHNKVQTQKHLKQSQKLLKSLHHLNSNKKVQQKSFIDNVNQNYNFSHHRSDESLEKDQQISEEDPEISKTKKQTNRKQKRRCDKNIFTFIRPSMSEQNGPYNLNDQLINDQIYQQSQHMINFHSQLMNNSSMCIPDQISSQQNNNNYISKKSLTPNVMSRHNLLDLIDNRKTNYDINDGKNHQKMTITIKTLKIPENLVTCTQQKKSGQTMRRTLLEQNKNKEIFEIQKRLNLSSYKAQNRIKQQSQYSKYPDDSWYDSDAQIDSKQQKNILDALIKPTQSQQKSIYLLRPQVNSQSRQSVASNKSNKHKSPKLVQRQQQPAKNQEQKQQYKVHPEEMLYFLPKGDFRVKKEKIRRNAEFCEEEQNIDSPTSRLNMASLRNLKMNCDIRRKR